MVTIIFNNDPATFGLNAYMRSHIMRTLTHILNVLKHVSIKTKTTYDQQKQIAQGSIIIAQKQQHNPTTGQQQHKSKLTGLWF